MLNNSCNFNQGKKGNKETGKTGSPSTVERAETRLRDQRMMEDINLLNKQKGPTQWLDRQTGRRRDGWGKGTMGSNDALDFTESRFVEKWGKCSIFVSWGEQVCQCWCDRSHRGVLENSSYIKVSKRWYLLCQVLYRHEKRQVCPKRLQIKMNDS